MRRKYAKIIPYGIFIFILLLGCVVFLPVILADQMLPINYVKEIQNCAAIYNIPASRIAAIIKQESNFNPNAVSPAGAQGLMQIMPATFNGMVSRMQAKVREGNTEVPERLVGRDSTFKADPFNPETNICIGTAYYAGLVGRYEGNEVAALAAYNGGGYAASQYLDAASGLNSETSNYVSRVPSLFAAYEEMYGSELEKVRDTRFIKSSPVKMWDIIINYAFGGIIQ